MKRGRTLYALEVERAEGTTVQDILFFSEPAAQKARSELKEKEGVIEIEIYPLKVGRPLKQAK